VIEIQVDDSAFKRFYALFDDYSEKLEKMPEAWKSLDAAMGTSTEGLKTGALDAKEALALAAAQATVIAEALKDATKAQSGLGSATKSSAKGMQGLAKATQGVGAAIAEVGGWILKIGALGGLGALFSGFGVADLASAAFTRFRAAGQLGISPGALASFQVNMQQFLGTAALEAAANAQIDVTKAGGLAALGIGWQHAQSISPSQLAFEELKSAALLYQKAQKTGTPAMQVPGIALYTSLLGGNIGDVRNAAMNMGALNAANAARQRDAGILGVSQQAAQAWANLHITLDKAGLSIQSALIDSLAPLAPAIAVLADDVASFIRALVKSPDFGVIVNDVATGLKEFGAWLKGPDPKAMWTNIKLLGEEIGVIAQKFAWLLPTQPTKPGQTLAARQAVGVWDWLGSAFNSVNHAAVAGLINIGQIYGVGPYATQAMRDIQTNYSGPEMQGGVGGGGTTENLRRLVGLLGFQGIPFGIYDANYGHVTGGRDDVHSQGNAIDVDELARQPISSTPLYLQEDFVRMALGFGATGVGVPRSELAAFKRDIPGANIFPDTEDSIHLQVAGQMRATARHLHAAIRRITPPKPALKTHRTTKPPVHVSITNSTAARVAVSVNAVAVS
jgi:hypothetical protein